ncbi:MULTISPECIES: hypothetical protein [Acidithiobacillus]|uniref:Uncharacterized protein n=2 Tax=Acidithiobacillus TaxID=119977 RepID=A0A179BNW6_ACIFR|nr:MULTISPECIES: hypothetical protein [Acidithiobacillus]MEB8474716.1 hypothetical protein [Acidithiobacillus ferriphilus]MEB8488158.1 hypothetical protein [Acidithiobacillus ferriphilus]MEB8488744.1 hypothetical protein [Acidithiobacillus ferriphilus]MEB8492188.1 hypothetical protein [Acidithiobacillus ferriphilus]MEB8513492.1 hypothetical protein [Acidithiobacillus ferriphilus]
MSTKPDFTQELAELVIFMSNVATAIRMHTPYNSQARSRSAEENNKHVLWLADSIHSFAALACAIKTGGHKEVIFACDLDISRYQHYLAAGDTWVSDPMQTFGIRDGRSYEWIVSEGIALLERIKSKTQQIKMAHAESTTMG